MLSNVTYLYTILPDQSQYVLNFRNNEIFYSASDFENYPQCGYGGNNSDPFCLPFNFHYIYFFKTTVLIHYS